VKTAKFPPLIDSFSGSWYFLSNFYLTSVQMVDVPFLPPFPEWMWHLTFPSTEHAFQAAKFLIQPKNVDFTDPHMTAADAKMYGRTLKPIRTDWEKTNVTGRELKLDIMEGVLEAKFNGSILRRKLLSTFRAELVEGNHWHDTYWGVCNGTGRRCNGGHDPFGDNHLGKLLMKIRDKNLGGAK
jgi:ribA/ribD-fused uncharacterized protein